AQRARAERLRQAPKAVAKNLAVVAVAVGVVAGAWWGIEHLPKDAGTGHIHAGFKMFDNGTLVPFNDKSFDLTETGFARCHLHNGDRGVPYVMHIEGKLGITLQECFQHWGMSASGSTVTYSPAQGRASHGNNATYSWQLWVDLCGDGANNWYKEPALFKFKPVQHSRMLITFAPNDATAQSLTTELNQVPS